MKDIQENFSILNAILAQDEITKTEIVPRFFPDFVAEAKTLSQTCKGFQAFFQPNLIKEEISTLLTLIAHGKRKEAEEMIKRNPRLLLEKVLVTDYCGRQIYGTAWQIAAGAEDLSNGEKFEEMLEMIERHLRVLPNGEAALAQQKAEQFPQGWQEIEKQKEAKDKEQLYKVLRVIDASHNNAECEAAIEEFREYLRPKGVIKSGKHSNVNLLDDFFRMYAHNYQNLSRDGDDRKLKLLWDTVGGEIQANLPSCYAQALCCNISNLIAEIVPLSRNLMIEKIIFFYERDPKSKTGIGYDCAVYNGSIPLLAIPPFAEAAYHLADRFHLFLNQKQKRLANFIDRDVSVQMKLG